MQISKNIIYFLLAILLGVFLSFGIFYFLKIRKNYVAVFLNDGAVYFGELSVFPRLKLTKAIFFQQDQLGQLSVQRFSDIFWMPAGPIYLNRDNILFIAPLSPSSPLINLIERKAPLSGQIPYQINQPLQQLQKTPTSSNQ